MADRTQVCNLKIRIEETLFLPKARGVITENILLLKYQKQTITVTITVTKSHQVLSFIIIWDTSSIGNKVPD